MAEKRVSVRLAAVGGKQVRAELEGVGDAGAKGFGRMSKEAEAANATLASFASKAGFALGAMVGAFLSIRTISATFNQFASATVEAEAAQAQLAAALASTGGAAQRSIGDLNATAAALQKTTVFGDDATNAMQGLLLTFTNIKGDVFDQATVAIQNVATALHTDLQSAALQVGKALNDPVLGMTALSRSGIQFSEAQKKAVKAMVATNNIVGAQTIILAELENQFGGSAEAARNTLGGALTALGNAWGDLFELSGPATESLRLSVEGLIDSVSDPAFFAAIQGIGSAMFGAMDVAAKALAGVVKVVGFLADHIDTLGVALGTMAAVAGGSAVSSLGLMTVALWAASAASTALGAAVAFLTGPVGLVLLAGAAAGALYEMAKGGGDAQKAVDQLTLAIGSEITQTNTLLGTVGPGVTMSQEMATAKLHEATARLANIDAMRQEQIAAVQSSYAWQEIQTVLDSMERTLAGIRSEQANFAPSFDRGEIDDFIATMADAKAEQAALLAGAGALSPEYVAVTEKIAALEAAIAGAVGGVVTFEGHVLTADDLAARLAATAAGIDFAGANASAAAMAGQLGIAVGLARALSGIGNGPGGTVIFDPRDPRYDPAAAATARMAINPGTVSPFDTSRLDVGTKGGGGGAASSIDQVRQAYDTLLASLDPAIAASQKFAEGQKTIKDALAAQVISSTDAAHAMDLLTAAAGTGAGAWDAISKSLADYAASARNIGGDIGNSLVGAFQGAESAFRDFVTTGKADFSSLVQSMLADLATLAFKQTVLGPLASMLGLSLGPAASSAGVGVSVFHAGGMVGGYAPTRVVPPMAFDGAPRMHGGGWAGLKPDEVPAILQRGEAVLPRGAGAGGAGGTLRIIIEEATGFAARVRTEAQGVAVEVVRAGLDSYDREMLPVRIGQVAKDTRRRG